MLFSLIHCNHFGPLSMYLKNKEEKGSCTAYDKGEIQKNDVGCKANGLACYIRQQLFIQKGGKQNV